MPVTTPRYARLVRTTGQAITRCASAPRRRGTGCRRSARAPVRPRAAAAQRIGDARAGPGDAARGCDDRLHRQRQMLPGLGDRPDGRCKRQQRPQELRRRPSPASCRRPDAAAGPPRSRNARPAPRRRRDCGRRPATAPNPAAAVAASGRAGAAAAPAIPLRRCRAANASFGTAQAGRAQRGDGDAGIVELERARQRRRRQRRARPRASA